MCIKLLTLTMKYLVEIIYVGKIGRIISGIKQETCNNNHCAELYLGTAPWTSTYIIFKCYVVVKYL